MALPAAQLAVRECFRRDRLLAFLKISPGR